MPLTPWKSMWETKFPSLREEMDRVFEEFFGEAGFPTLREADWLPAVDVVEREGDIVVAMDIPAIDPKEVKITILEDKLTVEGERKRDEEFREENCCRSERVHGSFLRCIQLPAGVVGEKASATYREGVLKIAVPKSQKPVSWEIKVSVQEPRRAEVPARPVKQRRKKNEG
ncbi:MAG: Hsp20/alpha crystallin family protein [Syntrophorhabdaceae bacterium]|nr:Hsp20/alpha crystallin family protein [Syntrophorhabdaceae bacterium]